MSRKRALMTDVYRNKKRICSGNRDASGSNSNWDQEGKLEIVLPSDTKSALLFLKGLFPVEKFEGRLPPIIVKHQLYSVIKNRTLVDKELADLRNTGEVRLFKLGTEADEYCIVLTEDYKSHVQKTTATLGVNKTVIERFLTLVLPQYQELSLNKSIMMDEFKFKDEEITQLVKACVLTVRDVGSWWIAIPAAGIFMKSFIRGRKALLMMVRKCKYREILQKDLEERKLPKVAKLGMQFHIHDIIGAELVHCIQTTSGQLLRLVDS